MKPAHSMTDDDLKAEQAEREKQWDGYHASMEGKSGSPGEWIIERLDEIQTERRRRIISLDGDIGRREPRL